MATFTVTIPDEEAAEVTACLAISQGYPKDVNDPLNAADMTNWVQTAIATLLQNMVTAIKAQQAQAAALAALTPPAPPNIVITTG